MGNDALCFAHKIGDNDERYQVSHSLPGPEVRATTLNLCMHTIVHLMGSRKRSKPNPKAEAERQLPDRPKSEGHALLQNDFETAVEDQGTAATEAVSRTDVGSNTVSGSG